MKQISSTAYEADKLGGNGKLKFHLWVDDAGKLYVQIEDNPTDGTFSKLLFSTSEYAVLRNDTNSIGQPIGYDLTTNTTKGSSNTNDGAFLKAVLRSLLPN